MEQDEVIGIILLISALVLETLIYIGVSPFTPVWIGGEPLYFIKPFLLLSTIPFIMGIVGVYLLGYE